MARALAAAAGVRPERATRVRAVVEELVREAIARPRAPRGRATPRSSAPGRRPGCCGSRSPTPACRSRPAESRHAPSRRLAALGFVDELHIRARGKDGQSRRVRAAARAARVRPRRRAGARRGRASRLGGRRSPRSRCARWRPGDALGLVRCVYRCYGYSYKDSLLYEPRHIADGAARRPHALGRRRHARRRPSSATAPPSSSARAIPYPEAGRLVVDPRYRGHHLAERLATARRELRRPEHGLPGIWAEAVTNHPSSQREMISLGGAEVGPVDRRLAGGGADGRLRQHQRGPALADRHLHAARAGGAVDPRERAPRADRRASWRRGSAWSARSTPSGSRRRRDRGRSRPR